MDKETQLFFCILLIPSLFYLLVNDYKSLAITGIAVFVVFLIWRFKEKIRENEAVMRILERFF